jgi:hypothetical protein
VWVEPLFGEAKDFHRLRRFRLRGLHKVNIEGMMVAAGQNLKRLIKHYQEEFRFYAQILISRLIPTSSITFSTTWLVVVWDDPIELEWPYDEDEDFEQG